MSIAYAFRPRLRSRLTLSGRAFLRKPWAFDGGDSHPSFRYSHRHSHFQALHGSSRYRFTAAWNAPLPSLTGSIASVVCLAPLHFRRGVTRLVSYYALFEWWLLLGCFPFDYGSYHSQSDSRVQVAGIRSLTEFGNPVGAPSPISALPPELYTSRLALKLFRGEPAISRFDWHFTATHTSSPHFSTCVGSDLQSVLPDLHPGHG